MTTTPLNTTVSASTEGLPSTNPPVLSAPMSPSADRSERIRKLAYARYEQRGHEPGHEEEDWLAAEALVDGEANQATGAQAG